MKAAFVTAYGGPEVIEIKDTAKPAPKPGEVLVKIHAAAVTAGDARLRGLDVPAGFRLMVRLMFGWSRPRRPVMGWCFAGTVESLGEGVENLAIGTSVMGLTGAQGGAHAEYAVVPKDRIVVMPEGLRMDEAASFFFGGLTAQNFLLGKAALKRGEHVLINGATGSVGSAAIVLAKSVGARVTAVCSAQNSDLASDLGADVVLDYRKDKIEGPFDVVMDVIGTLQHKGAVPLLRPGGRLILITAGLGATISAGLRPMKDGIRRIAGTSSEGREAMEDLVRRYLEGSYRPLVGKVLPFDDIRAAHAIASARHKPGNLVLRMV